MHRNSQLIFERKARPFIHSTARVLEIGPDAVPSSYQRLAGHSADIWDTTDLFSRVGLTFQMHSEFEIPVADDSYDVVLSGQVMEHVRKPWIWIKELVRVCKSGGHVITIAPVSWPYHEAPIDCWRVYPEGMRALLEDEPVEILINEFQCLEENVHGAFVVPGRSASSQWRKQRLLGRWLNGLGVPREAAFDLIAVARKL